MKLHEYQAKELFACHGLPVPGGETAETVAEGLAVAERLGYPVAIKAQVHAGGRGKAGGVRLARNRAEAGEALKAILNMTLRTAQTGDQGLPVRQVLVEKGVAIRQEFYLSILPDRASGTMLIIGSGEGGMNIEEVAARTPERIARIHVDPLAGLQPFHVRRLAFELALSDVQERSFFDLMTGLYRAVTENDLLLAEINPLVFTADETFLLLDAKAEVDSSSLFRHRDLAALRDDTDRDPLERKAARYNLNYIRLDGNIGTMVNGAGLAMATMDLIKRAGAAPANFLDVGGGANAVMIRHGFGILLADPRVRAILINIFGGILRCDVLARGVVEAARATAVNIPVVVRMEGTNVEEGRRILADSGLELINAVDIRDAAAKIAAMAGRL